ncbi:molecular chaperone [Yersinia ruckeri]|uniref:fimbrial biogenesis chaperone n=1 Tax=Yersinia ruckeri TaxID=29486 RepID=UPI002237302D|nr:molecular chaperone [Yersinia ruckeri]MCW6567186.1 molecular chaperone [Yersinia ruckeri]
MRSISYIVIILFGIGSANADVIVGGTRVIYNGEKKETSISVMNGSESRPYLIQSFIHSHIKGDKPPFIVTPPLFRLDAEKENTLRIMRTGGSLPTDRESVFYLNVKSIPSVNDNEQNTLVIAVKTRIKLFYRPEGIKGDADEAYKSLTFRQIGNQLEVKNPSNYYVTIGQLKVAGKVIPGVDMIAPQEIMHYLLPSKNPGWVSWNSINSYGGVSTEITKNLL